MLDITGKTITEGQYLKIIGCKVKGDNGIYIVNKQYEGGDYCLYKATQNGEEAKTKYNIYFLNERNDKEKQVTIVSKDELKQAAKGVKAYVDSLTAAEVIHTFYKAEDQEIQKGRYIKFKKSVLLAGHINSFTGTYLIEDVRADGGISLWLIGKKGERISGNINGYYQYQPIMLSFSAKTIIKLFEEGYIEVMERSTTTKGEAKQTEKPETESQKNIITEEPEAQEQTQAQTQEHEQTTVIEEPEAATEPTEHNAAKTEERKTIKPKYYNINEEAARQARGMWSFSDYEKGSETEAYKTAVNKVYAAANKVIEKHPDKTDKAESLADRFSKKYADWINTKFQIDLMCPSIMISGGSNFPIHKKQKQNARMDKHYEEYNYIMGIPAKLQSMLYGNDIIKSNDENAIERLQEKIFTLTEELERSKNMNKHYRKNGTMKGFEGLTDEQAVKLDEALKHAVSWANSPAPSFELTSIRNKIKAAEGRIKEIQRLKETAVQKQETPSEAYKNDVCEVVENPDNMRLQLFFDGKPSESIRSILKSNGFRWSPTEGAWQRQLTDNARYTTKKVIQQISAAS